jgi:hypothetical protein
MQPPFDPYAALFSAGEVAEMSGVSRAIIDVWVTRTVIEPSRRQRAPIRKRSPNKKRVAPRVGRPVFSCRDVFKVLLVRVLADRLTLASPESSRVARLAELAKIADAVTGGNWMWALARSIERGNPLRLYAYATRSDGEWSLDMHIGEFLAAPKFGFDVPHIFVPMTVLFDEAYQKCRQLVGEASLHDAQF